MSDDKPWMDYDRLLELEQEHDTYTAMADELGCHSNTVRKHLERAHNQQEQQPEGRQPESNQNDSEQAHTLCKRCEDNDVPGGAESGNSFCPDCLDEVRHDA